MPSCATRFLRGFVAVVVTWLPVMLFATRTMADFVYRADDGSAENAFGFIADPGDPPIHDLIYLNRFAVQPNADLISDVDFDDIDDFVLGLNDPDGYELMFGVPPSYAGDTDEDRDHLHEKYRTS